MKLALQKFFPSFSNSSRPRIKKISAAATPLCLFLVYLGLHVYKHFLGIDRYLSALMLPRQQEQSSRLPYKDYVNKTYDSECTWIYDESLGGYPPVANDGRTDLATYICPSTFRDLSDYVYSWPYSRFAENKIWVADHDLAVRNLPPVRTKK